MGDSVWRQRMWGSIIALHGRYPKALAHLKDGWWEDASHVETLCALVLWRDWIDVAADDPRHEPQTEPYWNHGNRSWPQTP
jgi:hypothetical protein